MINTTTSIPGKRKTRFIELEDEAALPKDPKFSGRLNRREIYVKTPAELPILDAGR